MNIRGSVELDTKAQESAEEYVYRGPKNKTGIFKNSMILKDLTGYVDKPDVNETLDAGTQTLVHEEPKADDQSTDRLFNSAKLGGAKAKTANNGTPTKGRSRKAKIVDRSTKRNSVEGGGKSNSSLDRLE